jgi:methyl-accepting chemotaxis protein
LQLCCIVNAILMAELKARLRFAGDERALLQIPERMAANLKLTLKKKILLPAIILLVLVMSVSTAITYFFFWKSSNAKITNQLSDIATAKVELIDLWIKDLKALMQTSAERAEYEAFLKEETESSKVLANRSLAEQVKNAPGLSYIHLVNAQGEVRASSIPDSVGKVKVPEREYFQKALKGQVNVSTVYLARTTGKPAFAVAAPVKDGDKVLGVIVGVPDLTKFDEEFIDSAKVLHTGYVTISDASEIVFAHKDQLLIMKMNLNEY